MLIIVFPPVFGQDIPHIGLAIPIPFVWLYLESLVLFLSINLV